MQISYNMNTYHLMIGSGGRARQQLRCLRGEEWHLYDVCLDGEDLTATNVNTALLLMHPKFAALHKHEDDVHDEHKERRGADAGSGQHPAPTAHTHANV